MSLLDRIIEQRNNLPIDKDVFGGLMDGLGQAECVAIDNVESHWRLGEAEKEIFKLSDFPVVAPPFPFMFFSVDSPIWVRPMPDGLSRVQQENLRVRRYGVAIGTREIVQATVRIASVKVEGEKETCAWTYTDSEGYYDTACGKAFVFNYHPVEPQFVWCPYCGKSIAWKTEAGTETEAESDLGWI